MTVTIHLEPELESVLRRQAHARGQELSDYIYALLRSAAENNADPLSSWPDDYFEKTYGSLHDAPLKRLPQGGYEQRARLL